MLVNAVLVIHKGLCLFHGDADVDPTIARTGDDAIGFNIALKKPRTHGINGAATRSELARDFKGSPMFTIIWTAWVRYIEKEVTDTFNVRLL